MINAGKEQFSSFTAIKSWRSKALLLVMLFSSLCHANPNNALGRLFLDPELRAAIDAARAMPPSERQTLQQDSTSEPTSSDLPISNTPIRLKGLIRRGEQNQKIWLEPVSTTNTAVIANNTAKQSLVEIELGDQRKIKLKPGQIYLPTENRIVEAYNWHHQNIVPPASPTTASPLQDNAVDAQ